MKDALIKLRNRKWWKDRPLLTGVVGSVLGAGVVYILTLVPVLHTPILRAISGTAHALATSVQLPLWAILLLLMASPLLTVASRRLRGRDRVHHEADIRTLLSAWVNRNSHRFSAAIEFTKVDRQLNIPSGGAKRYLTEEAAKLHYFSKSEGPNTLLLEYRPPPYSRRTGLLF